MAEPTQDEIEHEELSSEEFKKRVGVVIDEWLDCPDKALTVIVDYDYDSDRVTYRGTRHEDNTYEWTQTITSWRSRADDPLREELRRQVGLWERLTRDPDCDPVFYGEQNAEDLKKLLREQEGNDA